MTMSIQSEDIVRQLSVDVAATLEKHQYFEQLTEELNKQHDVEKKKRPEDAVESLAFIASVAWSQQPLEIKTLVEQSSALDNKLSSIISSNVNQLSATSQLSNITSIRSSASGNSSDTASAAFMHRANENSKIVPAAVPQMVSPASGSENNTQSVNASARQIATNLNKLEQTTGGTTLEKGSRGDLASGFKSAAINRNDKDDTQNEQIRQNAIAHLNFSSPQQNITALPSQAQHNAAPHRQLPNPEIFHGSKTVSRIDVPLSTQPITNEIRDDVREKEIILSSDTTDLNLRKSETSATTTKLPKTKEEDVIDGTFPLPVTAQIPLTPTNLPDTVPHQAFTGRSPQRSSEQTYVAPSVKKAGTLEGIKYSLNADKSVQITGSVKKGYVLHSSDREVKRILDKHADQTLQVTIAELGDESAGVHSDQLTSDAVDLTNDKSEE